MGKASRRKRERRTIREIQEINKCLESQDWAGVAKIYAKDKKKLADENNNPIEFNSREEKGEYMARRLKEATEEMIHQMKEKNGL